MEHGGLRLLWDGWPLFLLLVLAFTHLADLTEEKERRWPSVQFSSVWGIMDGWLVGWLGPAALRREGFHGGTTEWKTEDEGGIRSFLRGFFFLSFFFSVFLLPPSISLLSFFCIHTTWAWRLEEEEETWIVGPKLRSTKEIEAMGGDIAFVPAFFT
ncbi:hypothetical protein QBC43DRAFT_313504 [Cladorrhinum sp. PSN259]|nr:hypothetical protein QBC43DRAFT_313504 [Cladorrhinum sp. PSN259]